MDSKTTDSIIRLRELREDLCKKQSQWTHAFAVKDLLVEKLRDLQSIALDSKTSRQEILDKIECLLIMMDPERQKELEAKNVK
jgi:hypothetical protein